MENLAQFIVEFDPVPEETKNLFSGVDIQSIGDGFSVIYSPWEDVLNRMYGGRFSYYSVPKLYNFDETPYAVNTANLQRAMEEAGISEVKEQPFLNLRGTGIAIGVIGGDFDYSARYLRYSNGNTRFNAIWDQTNDDGRKPENYIYGTEYSRAELDESLINDTLYWQVQNETNVNRLLKIMCGNVVSNELENRFEGIAPDTTIIAVKLKEAEDNLKDFYGIKRNTKVYSEADIMTAISYIYSTASKLSLPVVILLNCNSRMGGHTGRLPLDIYSGIIADKYGVAMVGTTGDNANKRGHFEGSFLGFENEDYQKAEIRINDENGIYLEMWADSPENYSVSVTSPSGEVIERVRRSDTATMYEFIFDNATAFVENRIAEGRDNNPVVIIRLLNPASGVWTINVYGENIVSGNYHMWLTDSDFSGDNTYFLNPDPYVTLTDISTTENIITVASYNPETGGINVESGRGFTRNKRIKPEISAASLRNTITDTSAAICAGAVALCMEWAITRRNEPAVRTIEIKNFLLLGTIRDRDISYPSEIYGYGKMNLYLSFSRYRV